MTLVAHTKNNTNDEKLIGLVLQMSEIAGIASGGSQVFEACMTHFRYLLTALCC